jgi:hypothetical protein
MSVLSSSLIPPVWKKICRPLAANAGENCGLLRPAIARAITGAITVPRPVGTAGVSTRCGWLPRSTDAELARSRASGKPFPCDLSAVSSVDDGTWSARSDAGRGDLESPGLQSA